MAIPLSITKYIRSMWMAETVITYLHVDKQGNLQSWGGHPRHYGLSNLIADRPATEQLYFLEGLLTAPHSQKLEFVGLATDRYAHVSIIPTTEGTWVLLFDATAAHDQKQKMQQQVNELSLLTYRQSQLLQGLEATRKSLEEEKQKLEEVIESKTNYISTLIKTMQMPMECVDGYHQLLNKVELIEARTTDYLNVVKNNTNQLLSDINHVLDETKSEAGQVALYISHCEIKVLLENLVSIFQSVAQAKGLLFSLEIKENVPPRVMLDELRFQQILINLITNGLKFTPKGFVTVTMSWEREQLHFVVADSGSGISSEAQQKIFMPSPPNTTDKSMGLAISQHFVKLMGGQLTVESSPKMGSMFKGFVVAPLPLVHNTPTRNEHEERAGATILIADSSPEVRILLALYLEEAGYVILTAETGSEAIDLALQEQPELILMDLQLAEMDGYEVVKDLRDKAFQPPIIALSGSSLEQDRDYALAVGCNEYLVKPVPAEILLKVVANCLAAKLK